MEAKKQPVPASDDDDVPAWQKKLKAGGAARVAEPPRTSTPALSSEDSTPSWQKKIKEKPASAPAPAPSSSSSPDDDVPEWQRRLKNKQSVSAQRLAVVRISPSHASFSRRHVNSCQVK